MRRLARAALGLLLTPLAIAVPLLAYLAVQAETPGCVLEDGLRAEQAVPAEYAALVREAAAAHGVPTSWLAAVITVESSWDPGARSPVGAMGLGQLMPATARALGVSDPWDPRQSIDGAARYLRQQHATFGDWALAVAAYNAGPGAVARHGGIPPYPETQAYVPRVRALAEAYATAGAAQLGCAS